MTEIQCAKGLGIVPTVGIGAPLSAVVLAGALLLAAPIPRRRLGLALVVGAIAAVGAGIAFVALWPYTWDGFDSRGAPLSMNRPLDRDALLLVVIVAGAAGALAAAHVIGPIRDRLGRRDSDGA